VRRPTPKLGVRLGLVGFVVLLAGVAGGLALRSDGRDLPEVDAAAVAACSEIASFEERTRCREGALPEVDAAAKRRTPVPRFEFPGLEGEPRTHSARLEATPPFQRGGPTRVRIPQLGVDAAVVETGVDTGTMALEVPPTGDVIGWYRHGPAPGDPGSSVLAGHVDYNGSPGVFFELRNLAVGAPFEVDDADGTTRRFTVVGRQQIPKTSLPTVNLFSSEGSPRVALVTCGGSFDRQAGSYEDNVLVHATAAE
jgi:hypothetical protein